MPRTLLLAIGIGAVLTTPWLTQAASPAEAAPVKARNTHSPKASAGDKGVAWVSGAGGVRGHAKAGKRVSTPRTKGGIRRGEWILDVGRSN